LPIPAHLHTQDKASLNYYDLPSTMNNPIITASGAIPAYACVKVSTSGSERVEVASSAADVVFGVTLAANTAAGGAVDFQTTDSQLDIFTLKAGGTIGIGQYVVPTTNGTVIAASTGQFVALDPATIGQTFTARKFNAGATANFLATGNGSVTRTLDSKLSDTVSVKDFGAVGDGTTDDTAKIQAALNSGAANVLLPKGVYIITSPLYVPENIVFRGEIGGLYSNGSVIKKTTTTNGTGSNTYTSGTITDSYVKNAILIFPHADNQPAFDICIEDMRLESLDFIVEYGIYAPRTASLIIRNVAIRRCKIGYYTKDSWITVFDHVNINGDSIETQLAAKMGLTSAYGWASGSKGFWYDPDPGVGTGTSMDARNVTVRDVGTAWDINGLNYSSMVACANDNISQCVYNFGNSVISTQGCGMENVFCGNNTGAIRCSAGKTSISGMSTFQIWGNDSGSQSGYIWISDDAQLNLIGSNFVALSGTSITTLNLTIGSGGNIVHDACTTMPSGGNAFTGYGSGSSKVLIANPIQINDSVGTKYVKGRITDNLVQEKQDKEIVEAGTNIATFTLLQSWPSDFYAAELTITTVDATPNSNPRSVCIAKYLLTICWVDAGSTDIDITLVASCISGAGTFTVPVLSSSVNGSGSVVTLTLTPGAGEGDCVARLISLEPTYSSVNGSGVLDVTAVLL